MEYRELVQVERPLAHVLASGCKTTDCGDMSTEQSVL